MNVASPTPASPGPRAPSAAPAAAPPAGRQWIALPLLGAWWAITAAWWALAFLAATPAAPGWLVRTQAVCFGTLPNGLPDAYGWTRLIVAPVVLLLPLLVVHGTGLAATLGRLWRGPPLGRALLIAGLAGVVVLTAAEGTWVVRRVAEGLAVETARTTLPGADTGLPANYPRVDQPAPDFTLVAQGERPFTLSALRGQVVYLTFAFGHCNATCPLTVQAMVRAARTAPEVSARVVVVSMDPWRDRPSALASLAEKWGLGDTGTVLSGTVAQVLGVLARYHMPTQRNPDTGNISHPPLVYVIDPQGRIAYLLNNPGPDWIAEAGRRAARG